MYKADSWGGRKYHDLDSRGCDEKCACRPTPSPKTHAFYVESILDQLSVTILDNELLVALKGILGPVHFGTRIALTTPSLLAGPSINGFVLLRHYNKLQAASMLPSLQLLVDGFLSDGEVWSRFGWQNLRSYGIIDDNLLKVFRQQQLVRNILKLDSGFKAADGAGSWLLGNFSDASSASHYVPWPSIQRYNRAQDHLSGHILNSTGPAGLHVPIHCNISGFYNQPPQDLPPTISASLASQGLDASDTEAINSYGTAAAPAELFGECYLQPHLNGELVKACAQDTVDAIKTWINLGADVNAQVILVDNTTTPLISAVESNRQDVVRTLVDSGALMSGRGSVVHATGVQELTPLLSAVEVGNVGMAQLLLELGADVSESLTTQRSSPSSPPVTALTEAARLRNLDMFKFLLLWDSTFSLGLKDVNLISAADTSPSAYKIRCLISACSQGNLQSVVELQQSGVHINAVSMRGTALSAAARARKQDIVKYLIKHGADVTLASLHLTRAGFPDIAQNLVKRAYSSVGKRGFRNLQTRFIKQYDRLKSVACTSKTESGVFKKQFSNYRRLWSSGIEMMKRICRGDPPTEVGDTISFLAVARVIAETLVGESGDTILIDKFDHDLLRWQQLFSYDAELEAYREVVDLVWNVKLGASPFVDKDFEDAETLDRFRELILTLIEGAREALGLDSMSGSTAEEGLESSLGSWRRTRARENQDCVPGANTNAGGPSASCPTWPQRPVPSLYGDPLSSGLPLLTPSPVFGSTPGPGAGIRGAAEGLLASSLYDDDIPSHGMSSVAAGKQLAALHQQLAWLCDEKPLFGAAEYLIRGTIFAITFSFLYCLAGSDYKSALATSLVLTLGIDTLKQRMAILTLYMRCLGSGVWTNGWASDGIAHEAASGAGVSEQGSDESHPRHWYGMLGSFGWKGVWM